MSDLWDEEGLPELATPRELDPLSLSPRHVNTEIQMMFFVGQLLAHLHSEGLRYTDLHRGNYGTMPVGGGLVIIDPGGMIKATLDPQNMAGDFAVPLLDYTAEEFQAFVCGYVERSHVLLDARHPGFTDQVLASVGISAESITADPRQDPAAAVEGADEWTHAVAFATVCLIICSDAQPDCQDAFLAGFLEINDADAWPEGRPLAEIVTAVAIDKPSFELIEALAADRAVGPFPDASLRADSGYSIRPNSRGAAQILGALDQDDGKNALLREAFIKICFLLASEACDSDSNDGTGAAIALLTLGFAIAADHSTDVERYERLHYWMWQRQQSMPISSALSLARVEAKDMPTALGAALFYFRAGLFEMEYFGASLSAAQVHGESLCAYAIVSAVRLFRRAVIVLSIYALPAARDTDTLALFRGVAHGVFSGYLHATRLVGTAATKLQNGTAAYQLWGSKADTMVECADWLQRCTDRLAASDLSEAELLAMFQEGRKHFVFEDFEVETPFDTIKLTRQDVYKAMFAAADDENADDERE